MNTEINTATRRNMFFIDPRAIEYDLNDNPRVDYGNLTELEASIAEHGVKDPITTKTVKGKIILIHGFRRLTATLNLIKRGVDVARIPSIPVNKSYTDEDAMIDHIIRNTGKPLTAMEEASVYKSLIGKGYKQTEIAKLVGKSQGVISNILKLSECTKLTQNYINDGLIASSLVMGLMKSMKDPKAVEAKVTKAIDGLDGKAKKVTEKTILVKRVSKYHKLFTGSIELLREQNVNETKIKKVETIMEALDSSSSEELAELLLTIV
jgi:ParB/RepB/Spo0J family partition protein